jgi:hypothetical protein
MLLSVMLGIPQVTMDDYEHSQELPFIHPVAVIAPEIISEGVIGHKGKRLITYPGIKEDVYVPQFVPNPHIREELGLREDYLIVTVRPPANEAHYRNPESDELFTEVMNYFGSMEKTQLVILPRNENQAEAIRAKWPLLFESRKAIIPDHVIDGLNLMWHSDLVISGGGTMNREAAALGIPVYSIFRGTMGAVDKYLAEQGRLTMLESTAEVRTRIRAERRDRSRNGMTHNREVLIRIVDEIARIADSCNGRNGH